MKGKGLQGTGTSRRRAWPAGAVCAVVALALLGVASTASAAIGPAYHTYTTWGDTNLPPGGEGQITLHVHNDGDESPTDELILTDEVSDQLTIEEVHWQREAEGFNIAEFVCSNTAHKLTCNIPAFFAEVLGLAAPGSNASVPNALPAGWLLPFYINVSVDPGASGAGTNTLRLEGGGAPSVEESVQMPFSGTPSEFGVVPDSFSADVFDNQLPLGSPERQAGAHPFEQRVNFELAKNSGIDPQDGTRYVVAKGTVKTVEVTLPRGMIGNPEATPKCNPVDFGTAGSTGDSTGCPANTQVGYLNIHATAGTNNYGRGTIGLNPFIQYPDTPLSRIPIYNMVPPKERPRISVSMRGACPGTHLLRAGPGAELRDQDGLAENLEPCEPTGAEVTIWGVPGIRRTTSSATSQSQDGTVLGAPFGLLDPAVPHESDGLRFR